MSWDRREWRRCLCKEEEGCTFKVDGGRMGEVVGIALQ